MLFTAMSPVRVSFLLLEEASPVEVLEAVTPTVTAAEVRELLWITRVATEDKIYTSIEV